MLVRSIRCYAGLQLCDVIFYRVITKLCFTKISANDPKTLHISWNPFLGLTRYFYLYCSRSQSFRGPTVLTRFENQIRILVSDKIHVLVTNIYMYSYFVAF